MVLKTAGRPSSVTPKKWWGPMAARMLLMAAESEPSVAFLKPTGVEMPLAISRWVCASAVRAPDHRPTDEVADVLRHERVENLSGGRQAYLGDAYKEVARHADAFLDVERKSFM